MTHPQTFRSDRKSSSAEDRFIDLFQEAIGFAKAFRLIPEYPFSDIYGQGRLIDYALLCGESKYAFEIDGEFWHDPQTGNVTPDDFGDALLRQNSLVYYGWKVYRWSDRQIATEYERIKEQLLLFLEKELASGALDEDYLPHRQGEAFSLREHQEDALETLVRLREEGKSIGLLTHATGTGKTLVALSDAKSFGGRVLYLVHRSGLVKQTAERAVDLWPEDQVSVFAGKDKPTTPFVAATLQKMHSSLGLFAPDEFDYIIVDEAHHSPARTFTAVLKYFNPQFLLGLTATPDRPDGKSVLEFFQHSAHRLELREAVERGLLAPIRCVRVKTNVDLSKVRYNSIDYRMRDLEEAVLIPSRNRLIADAYLDHVRGRRAVCFCVNVHHAETMAGIFRDSGAPARHVSGRMSTKEREQILESYADGEIQVLCACDLLSEGWDSPETEVLLMARPTMSKVLYVQQLGRGTRKAEGKECLFVFDFVDNAVRFGQSLSAHRLFRKDRYREGGLVAAPKHLMDREEAMLNRGEIPSVLLHINLWSKDYEPIDIFSWKDETKEMLSLSELGVALRVGGGTTHNWLRAGKIEPDLSIPLGAKTYHFFHKDRVEDIRSQFGLKKHTRETLREDFFDFIREMDMSASYKPVFLLGMLQHADKEGKVSIEGIVRFFKGFYLNREEQGQVVEKHPNKMARVAELDEAEVQATLLTSPFEKFERRRFMEYDRDLAYIRFDKSLWSRLDGSDLDALRKLAEEALEKYYARFE